MWRGSTSGRAAPPTSVRDLVGATVNEAGEVARTIGAIQITDRFSLVEIPAEIADSVIETLRATTIKGKRVPVRPGAPWTRYSRD